ncbi:PAS domain-containing sensor histidine kinase [Halobellus marinus]|uniref:PAS domain-containing sensor histidine kinase n=1 Tax=Halobellus TaxID=1073986 RepID=UPI0028AA3F0B|nr:PAS domain-containing sensor histidine kinase [Halobellus sp. DFY28]
MTAGGNELVDGDAVLRSLREPVVVLTPGGSIAFANRRFLDVTQSDRSTVVGAEDALLEQYVVHGHDDLRAAVDAVAAGRVDEERVECEIRHPADAPIVRRLPAEIRVSPLSDGGPSGGVLLVFRDVSDRVRYERALERQKDRLDEVLGIISHDLRNPLNVATGNLELLADGREGDHFDAARRALDRMTELIGDLLTLARTDDRAGETSAVELDRVTEASWRTTETGGASPLVDTDSRIRADEERLRQLLANLLQNAVEHGSTSAPSQTYGDVQRRTDGNITVTVGEFTDGFDVEDDGCGVPPAECERVLEPGYTMSDHGTGARSEHRHERRGRPRLEPPRHGKRRRRCPVRGHRPRVRRRLIPASKRSWR